MSERGLGSRAKSLGWKLALVAGLTPGAAWGQDCQTDGDCGHGFQCIHTGGGTSSVTGVGGSTQPECGDGVCDGGDEDVESCPQDCDTIQYCAVAECDSNADCAEGYECGEEVGSNTSFTSAGGSSASVCGDGTCDIDENNDNCAEDCRVYRLCQPVQMQCTSDDDCADGFYCYLSASENSAVTGGSPVMTTGGSDTATNGNDSADTDGATSDDTGSSGSTDAGAGGTGSGFVPVDDTDTSGSTSGGDETGVCLPESSDSGSSGNVNTVGGVTGPADTSGATGADAGSSDAGGAGNLAASAGNGTPVTGGDGDGTGTDGEEETSASGNSASGSNASGSNDTGGDAGGAGGGGGSDPGAESKSSDDDGGCSCAMLGAQGSSGLLAAALFGLVAGIRRRRTDRR